MKQWQPLTMIIVVVFTLLMLVPGFVMAGDKLLKIDPEKISFRQDMRTEIQSVMEDAGYQWQPVINETTQQPVKVAEKYGQYQMLYKNNDNGTIQVEVHIRQRDGMTGLHFSEAGAKQPGDSAMVHFRKLKERLIQEFGADSVSDGSYFLTP